MNTLHIIGNGFDVAHKINSRYWDFYTFLQQKRYYSFIGQMENFFPTTDEEGENILWSDFETALGNIDIDGTYRYCTEDIEIDYDHMMRSTFQIEDAPGIILGGILQEMHEKFKEWITTIDINVSRRPLDEFDSKGRFLTFNYTETLESVYRIPSERVLHIHGNRVVDENLIVGHCNYIDPYSTSNEDNAIYEETAMRNIVELANQEMKSVESIIASHNPFWTSLHDVNKIVVYGHSLSNVDFPYFEMIRKSIDQQALWYFSSYTKEDVVKIQQLMNKLGLELKNCFSFKM